MTILQILRARVLVRDRFYAAFGYIYIYIYIYIYKLTELFLELNCFIKSCRTTGNNGQLLML